MEERIWAICLLSSEAEHWSCKPGVESSILSGGIVFILIAQRVYWYKFITQYTF